MYNISFDDITSDINIDKLIKILKYLNSPVPLMFDNHYI